MAILFNRIEKKNPRDPQAPSKYYASLKRIRQVKEKEVAALVADETTMDRKEVEMALDCFQKTLARLLLEGNSVQLGDWASIYLTCSSTAADTKDEVTARSITGVNVRFHAGTELTEALSHASFIAAETMVTSLSKNNKTNEVTDEQ
jgi:predicted histone-like DNA-binding protein